MSHDTALPVAGIDLDMLAYDIADTLDRGEYGLGDITQDDIRAALPAFLQAALTHARNDAAPAPAYTPPADAARTHAGDLKHICNTDRPGLALPFGRKAPEGQCPRCDELRSGATPRADHAAGRRGTTSSYPTDAEWAQHKQTCPVCSTGSLSVCTFGQW